ncbi:MAG: 3D domain-containing protein [Acidobacteriota bacterium]|nr:3D domain-containing protein [Acidobacteriota bacterium]
MKTTRNFVFLTITFAVLAALQFPQRELAQTLNGEIAKIEAKATAGATFVKPVIKDTSSKAKPVKIKNSNENLKTESVSAGKSATVFRTYSSAAGPFSATAYCLKGRTASGSGVRRGIIAADPRLLPLGTRVQLTAGAWSGTYTVADTGGKIKGRKIDLWVPNSSEARRFGRRNVHITVLGKK